LRPTEPKTKRLLTTPIPSPRVEMKVTNRSYRPCTRCSKGSSRGSSVFSITEKFQRWWRAALKRRSTASPSQCTAVMRGSKSKRMSIGSPKMAVKISMFAESTRLNRCIVCHAMLTQCKPCHLWDNSLKLASICTKATMF